jgi:hypothetical protein
MRHADIVSTIYDPSINSPNLYAPFIANSVNQNLSYTQVDLFYVLGSSIASL